MLNMIIGCHACCLMSPEIPKTFGRQTMKQIFTLKNPHRPLLAAGLIAATSSALALTQTTTFQVQATVNKQCSVSAVNLTFPAVDPLSSQTDGATTVTVNCTKNSAYTVGLDAGVTGGAAIAQRKMG